MYRKIGQKQVTSSHYSFEDYSSERRYISYYHQIKNLFGLMKFNTIKTILVVGKGDGVVPKIIEAYSNLYNLGLKIETFDIAADLKPNYLGDLLEIDKIINKNYDLIICCQMLEHIPFKQAKIGLKKMHKIAKNLIISVPYKAAIIRFSIKLPLLKEFDACIKIPILRKKGKVDERHYWELGASFSVSYFKKELNDIGYKILDSYILKKHGSQYFLVIKSI